MANREKGAQYEKLDKKMPRAMKAVKKANEKANKTEDEELDPLEEEAKKVNRAEFSALKWPGEKPTYYAEDAYEFAWNGNDIVHNV